MNRGETNFSRSPKSQRFWQGAIYHVWTSHFEKHWRHSHFALSFLFNLRLESCVLPLETVWNVCQKKALMNFKAGFNAFDSCLFQKGRQGHFRDGVWWLREKLLRVFPRRALPPHRPHPRPLRRIHHQARERPASLGNTRNKGAQGKSAPICQNTFFVAFGQTEMWAFRTI